VGIAHDKLEVIFEEFRQLEDQERGGTGLGLPIARRLARMMGGDIAVSSEVGQGSQFTVYLPLNSIPSTIT
jgi:signal transduction histidine kinase